MPQSSRSASDEVSWRFWREPKRVAVFKDTCWSMTRLVTFLLGVAFLAEYFVKLYLSEDALAGLVGRDNPLSVPVAALLAAPLYLDRYAALPLVRALELLGKDCSAHTVKLSGLRAMAQLSSETGDGSRDSKWISSTTVGSSK